MSAIVERIDGDLTLPEGPVFAEARPVARSTFVERLVFFWFCGTCLLGKDFSYLNIGSIFITEFTLVALIVSQRNQIRMADVFFFAAVLAYIGGGWWKHGSFFFAVKDIAWLYYLGFIRFFPRDFPAHLTRKMLWVVSAKVLSMPFLGLLGFEVEKYMDAILILMLLVWKINEHQGKFPWRYFWLGLVASFAIDFKSSIVLLALSPLVFRNESGGKFTLKSKHFVIAFGIVLLAVIYGVAQDGLVMAVDLLNEALEVFGVERSYSPNTAVWRAQIWTQGVLRLMEDSELIFGQLPGFNFLDSKYLGIKIALFGGDSLGVVRASHNIVVQMVMKTGLVGVCLYIWYYFQSFKFANRGVAFFQIMIIMMAMTADILEVPSRGPLFYCCTIMLATAVTRRRGAVEADPVT